MIILAVDQSEKGHCGWAVFNDSELIESGTECYYEVVDGKKREMQSARKRVKRYRWLLSVLDETYRPDVVILEQVRAFHRGYRNPVTIAMLAGLVGIAQEVFPLSTRFYLVNTSSWKAAIVGNGRAGKEESVALVKLIYKKVVTDDEADAICMGLYIESILRVTDGKPIKNILWCIE